MSPLFRFGGVVIGIFIHVAGGLLTIAAFQKYFDFGLKNFFMFFITFLLLEAFAQAVTTAVWAAIYSAVL
ncbi:MAG: hypothetical protein QGG73_02385 [Candidatus Hydrogenedentes bacterium]|nr:hypothetical protein [Candidatus Hydrogenedentota bacterium]